MNGVVGLETSFPVMYTHFVKTGMLPLERLVAMMSLNPARRFDLPIRGYTVYDLNEEYTVSPDGFLSMGKSSPFTDTRLFGKCIATVLGGHTVYLDPTLLG